MIPYFDENMGSRIPAALKTLGLKAIPGVKKQYGGGQGDIDYLTRAGQKDWLAISANKRMLDVQEQITPSSKQSLFVHCVFSREGLGLLLAKQFPPKSPV